MKKNTLTAERLRDLLHYDTDTGVFRRKVALSGVSKVGDIAGSYREKGYREVGVDGHRYPAHRLAWLYVYGHWPEDQVDHINGLTDDNRISNLREATHTQNSYNKGPTSRNTSGVKGVSWDRKKRKWRAQCTVAGKQYHQGYFKNLVDAESAAKLFREINHGQFARTTTAERKAAKKKPGRAGGVHPGLF